MVSSSNELFKKIRRIHIQTNRLAKDILAGAYRSVFKGKGMEFEEVREYQLGDEVRSVDWNVTARMGHPYVKNFREEREIRVLLMVDVSSSSRFGSVNFKKSDLIAEIGGVIAFSAIKNNDKVGLILFSDHIEKYVPPNKGVRHVLRVIRELLAYRPKGRGTNLGEALSFLGKIEKRSGICFLISDFQCPDYSHELALIAKNHDLIAIGITDPYELAIPPMGLVDMTDLETEETILADTLDTNFQREYKALSAQHLLEQKLLMQKVGAGFIDIKTNQPYLLPLQKFFKIRKRKRR